MAGAFAAGASLFGAFFGAFFGASNRRYRWYAAHAPSLETMVAPSGLRGVHSLPNAAHSCGLMSPWRTSPLRQTVDSSVSMPVTENRC